MGMADVRTPEQVRDDAEKASAYAEHVRAGGGTLSTRELRRLVARKKGR